MVILNKEKVVQLKNINKTFKVKQTGRNSIRDLFFNLFKKNKNKYQSIEALKNISITIHKGESIGIIGRNGSGKTTLLNIIMETIKPDSGQVIFGKGKMLRLSLGMGIDPNLSARDNIYVNGSLIGLTFKKIGEIFDDILSFAEIEEFVDTPVKFFSKGMKQRLLFSIAMYVNTEIIILDEFFGGTGDRRFRIKSNKAFEEKVIQGKTLIIVSHNLNIIKRFCSKAIVIEDGKIIKTGEPRQMVRFYKKNIN